MSDCLDPVPSDQERGWKSRFTYRDLRLLSQCSVTSPLRVITLVDFDCFYAQCEAVRLGLPQDRPLGVQQFKHVIAMNYAARAAGLKKVVSAVEAKQKCPDIVLQHVPTWREGDATWAYRDDVREHMDSDKSSLDYYRLQSRRAIEVVKRTLAEEGSSPRIEKAGIDELFLDLSARVYAMLLRRYPELTGRGEEPLDSALPKPATELLDWHDDKVFGTEDVDEDERVPDWDDVALNLGAEVVRDLRTEILKQLGYTCSAGIARNKVLAKLAAGHNKPNKQTVVRDSCITSFLSGYKMTKLRGLGGKLGDKAVKAFSADLISELLRVPLSEMQSKLGSESGLWVFRVIRGIEHGEVVSRTQIKSMLSAKTFTPKISGLEQAERWLRIFAADIMGRMADQEGRRPRTIAVHHHINGRFGPTRSKQAQIPLGSKLDTQCLFALSKSILVDITHEGQAWPCLCMSISVSDFVDVDTTSHSIKSLWAVQESSEVSNANTHALKDHNRMTPPNERPRKRTILDYHLHQSTEPQIPSNNGLYQEVEMARKKPRALLLKIDESVATSVATYEETEGEYHCPTCSKPISSLHVLEHLDWHVAVDLQNEG